MQDFLPLYGRNAVKIDSKKTGFSDYDHTLSTVWEMSFSKLSENSYTLLNLLAFFDSDAIHEIVLSEGSSVFEDKEFEFLHDEME